MDCLVVVDALCIELQRVQTPSAAAGDGGGGIFSRSASLYFEPLLNSRKPRGPLIKTPTSLLWEY